MSDYRDDRGALRQRIEALEAELERATERNQDLEEELTRARREESEAREKGAKAPAPGASTSAQRQQIAALVAGAAMIVCVGAALTTWDRDRRTTVAPVMTPTSKPVTAADSSQVIPLPPRIASDACSCPLAKGGSVRLAYRYGAALSLGGNTTYALNVTLQAARSEPELVLGPDSVPPSKLEGGDVRFGIACSSDRMVLAFRQRASAWSLTDGSPLWSADLPGAGSVGQGKNGPLRIECDVLASKDGVVVIPRAEGVARVSLEDGSLVKTSGGR